MKIAHDALLKDLTTMRTGGPAQFVAYIEKKENLAEALSFAERKQLPTFTLGGGSNIVAPDRGYAGVVFLMRNGGVVLEPATHDRVRVVAGAGETWDHLVEETVKRQLYGLENLSYIPGNVGAAPVQNIGAYGREAKDTIEWVEIFDRTQKKFLKLTNQECAFRYRDSIFKKPEGKDFIVTRVSFLLEKTATPHLEYADLIQYFGEHRVADPTGDHIRNAVIEIRKKKLPNIAEVGTAGSFFKNPIVSEELFAKLKAKFPPLKPIIQSDGSIKVSAAWLIEQVGGWKGYQEGAASVSAQHALVLLNNGNAKAEEIISLAEKIENDIFKKTGISLAREVVVWE